MSLKVPVLMVVFNRLETTKQVFEMVRKVKPIKLYIASDGPRQNKDGEGVLVDEVRDFILNNIDWDCDFYTLFRENNVGCKAGVYTAINWLFEEEEMGIILEDDCLPSLGFFDFCQQLLCKYENDTRVMSIAGTNFVEFQGQADYRYSNYSLIWGWATWKRAWRKFDPNIRDFNVFKEQNEIENYFLTKEERKFFLKNFEMVNSGEDSIWDAQWFYTCLINGMTIIPQKNLVKNIGFGRDATHTFNEHDKMAKFESYKGRYDNVISPPFFNVNRIEDYKVFKMNFYSTLSNKLHYYILKFISTGKLYKDN